MKTLKLVFWQRKTDRNGKQLPAVALGEAQATVADDVTPREAASHYEGIGKMFFRRDFPNMDYVTAEEV